METANVDELLEQLEQKSAFDSTEITLLDTSPLVSVIMTCFNVANYVSESIDSILNQTYKNLELIIIDDASSDNTVEIIKKYNDPRIRLFQNTINCGTYYSKNFGVTIAGGKYIAIQDSDDISDKDRIKKQVEFLESFDSKEFVVCQYTRFDEDGNHLIPPRLAFQSSMIRRTVFDKIGYYDSVRAAADEEFNNRMRLVFGPDSRGIIEELLYLNRQRDDSLTATIKIGSSPRTTYVDSFNDWHKHSRPSDLFVEYPLIHRPFPVNEKLLVEYHEQLHPTVNINEISILAEKVTCSLVSIPARKPTLKKVVESIIDQVDELRVYLNGFEDIPSFLKKDSKITIFKSQEFGDLADNGKFFKVDGVKGFHFTIDDDILYPGNYVSEMVDKIKKYHFEPVIGIHGIDIRQSFKGYYDESSREVFRFQTELSEDRYVHLLGTGTVAYHSNFVQFNLDEVAHAKMIDIYLASYCQEQKIPMICISRPAEWLVELETPDETRIYSNFVNSDTVQTGLIKKLEWEHTFLSFDQKSVFNKRISAPPILVKKLTGLYHKLNQKDITIDHQKKLIEKYENDLAWYSRTYDHLPKWFLKIGAIFRRVKIGK